MFTCEGYLTNTLPVTAAQHIMVKSVTAFSMNLLSAVVVVLSFVIALPFEMLVEFFENFDLFGEILYELGGQNLVQNLTALENVELASVGRHDPCIVHRARVVVDSVTALVLCDMLTGRFGTDWLVK